MIETLSNIIVHYIGATGYIGVFILMTLESALIPVPSEATMPFAGSLVPQGVFSFWILVIVGTLANLTGSLLAYTLGYLGEDAVLNFIRKYGKFVLIREKEYVHATHLFAKHGEVIVFVSRILPAIRTYISLPAGIARMNLKKFILYTTLGSFIWSIALVYLGLILGNNWRALSPYFHILDFVVVGAAFAAVAIFFYLKLRKK